MDHGRIYQGFERLNPIFEECIEDLTDQDGDNDSMNFRLLARVLAYAAVIEPPMMEYAQTAYSLQFSVVDVRSKVPVKGHTLMPDLGAPPVTCEEDLNPDALGGCDGCIDVSAMHKWDRRFHTCLVCTNVDLCCECYERRMRANEAKEASFG